MNLTIKMILIGAIDEKITLNALNYSNIVIKRKICYFSELTKEYPELLQCNDWPVYFNFKGDKIDYHELCYSEEIDTDSNELCFERTFAGVNKVRDVLSFINCYLGCALYIGCGVRYIGNKENARMSFPLIHYNTLFLNRCFVDISEKNLNEFLINIGTLMEKNKDVDTIVENYYSNLFIRNIKMNFLNLVTCLESLLVNNNFELSHQISRGVAVLLSKNKDDGNDLYEKMKKIYDIRSQLVHSGIWNDEKYQNKYHAEPAEDLKKMFVLSFRKYIRLNLNKKEFIKLINESGYGDLKDR